MQRRELLYGVVRECMTATGLLSSTYKFKVLSLDSSGREYLIMMDVPGSYLSDAGRLADMEGSIARSAKQRHDMLVTAVYWRVNEAVITHSSAQVVQHAIPPKTLATTKAELPLASNLAADTFTQEMMAFKRAATAAGRDTPKPHPPGAKPPERRAPAAPSDFSDTEPYDANSPLGSTQFGGLN